MGPAINSTRARTGVLKSSRPSYTGSITAAKKTDDWEADLNPAYLPSS
jgi:hypothetical protein